MSTEGVEFVRKGDGVAVVSHHEPGEAWDWDDAEAVGHFHHHAGGGVGGIQLAVEHFFPNGGPADFAGKADVEAVAFEKSEFVGHDERGAVGQRHVADGDPTA